MSDMRIEALGEQLDHSRDLRVIAEKHEAKTGDRSSANIVIDVGHRDMQEFADCFITPSSSIGEGNCEHPSVPHDRVLCSVSAAKSSLAMGLTFSPVRPLITSSAFSRWPYITNAMPTARDRMIFSC